MKNEIYVDGYEAFLDEIADLLGHRKKILEKIKNGGDSDMENLSIGLEFHESLLFERILAATDEELCYLLDNSCTKELKVILTVLEKYNLRIMKLISQTTNASLKLNNMKKFNNMPVNNPEVDQLRKEATKILTFKSTLRKRT